MVLEEATTDTPPQESIDDGQQPGQAGGPIRYKLDLEKLPRPYTLLPIQIQKMAAEKNGRETAQYLMWAAALLRRPPTQDEAEAAAYHLAQKNATVINAVQLGHYWGLWRAWSTRKNYNWPIIDPYKKYPDFNPSKFLGFEGQRAIFLRHCARVGVWGFWGIVVGHFISDTYASIGALRAIQSDVRLKAFVERRDEELKKRAHAQVVAGAHPVTPVMPAVNVQGEEGGSYTLSGNPAAGFYGGQNQAPAHQADQWSTTRPAAEVSDDDASPTGGLGLWDESNDSASRGSSWDRLRQQSASTASQGTAPKPTSSDNDWISQEASSQQPQQQGGAWDRIRQQHQQGAPQQHQQKNDDDGWWK
ncbi:uncharacterized protein BKA78DRAFT_351928 [Phyllosticta capitalensis]|uniref:uncharacterized protein n=1 Tax=Phyllosticta capitalensis TaxID=121624 RepID=UPI003130DA6F